jgi:hypothetical protein
MPEQPDWMPVFIASQLRQTRYAIHPRDQGTIEPPTRMSPEGDLPRVGTAIRQGDGTYVIHLWAVPLTGALLMRPPRPGEQRGPTAKGS